MVVVVVVMEFEVKVSHLHNSCSVAWAMPLALFALVILEKGTHFLWRPARTRILLF
jgi:hypothetical protein